MAWLGVDRQGKAGLACLGRSWLGMSWRGKAGKARLGLAWHGLARQDKAGKFKEQDMKSDAVKAGVQEVAQAIYDESGSVKASALVERAKPESSPAHAGFTWDDRKAADEYRLEEARRWIRVVVVKPADSEQAERMVHVPVVIEQSTTEERQSKEGEYKPISIVAESPDEYVRARSEVLAKGRAFAQALAELDHAAAKRGKADMSAVIAQISRGLDLFEKAIETLH